MGSVFRDSTKQELEIFREKKIASLRTVAVIYIAFTLFWTLSVI
jgi:hypothetical protein